jgi:putative SOS response-associated peptidase YedK
MCARYTLRKRTLSDVAEALDAEFAGDDEQLYKPRYNVAPTNLAWIVEYGGDRRVIRPATWNYAIGAGRTLVNIRSESMVFGRFRETFASRRCAVVTDGFYEWPGGGGEPVWFHGADDGLVLLGGLSQPATVLEYPRFAVLTTRPNELVAKVHDRMPVIISSSRLDEWLTGDPADALKALGPAADGAFVVTPVSKHVNNVRHDDPGCVAPRPEGGQRSLF